MGSPLFRFNKMKDYGKVERIVFGAAGVHHAGRLQDGEVRAG